MNKLKILMLFIGIFLQCQYIFSQTNLIPNPSFELGSPDPTGPSQLDTRCDDWKNFETSDWFKTTTFQAIYWDRQNISHDLEAHNGLGYIGFGGCEGAQARLLTDIAPNSYVRLSFWWTPHKPSDSEINVYLLNSKAPNSALNDCFNPNLEFEFIANITVNAGGADAIHEPGTWYHYISEEFFVAKDIYKWIAIKGENQPGVYYNANYIFVDDMTLTATPECEHRCALDSINVEWLSLPIATCTTITDFIYVQYATKVLFQVYNRWGNLVYELKAVDPSGLENLSGTDPNGNPFSYYAIRWEGTNENGEPLLFYPEVYTYFIRIENCTSVREKTLTVTIVVEEECPPPNHDTPIAYPDDIINSPPRCCDQNWIYQDEIIPPARVEVREVEDFIHLGENVDPNRSTGPVIFESGSESYLNAGNEITFFQGVTISSGAMFRAELGYECPSSSGKTDLSSIANSQTLTESPLFENLPAHQASISLFPNPSQGHIDISFSLAERDEIDLSLFDVRGKKVVDLHSGTMFDAGNHKIPLNMSQLAPGIYFATLQTSQSTQSVKVILQ